MHVLNCASLLALSFLALFAWLQLASEFLINLLQKTSPQRRWLLYQPRFAQLPVLVLRSAIAMRK